MHTKDLYEWPKKCRGKKQASIKIIQPLMLPEFLMPA